MGGVRRIRPYIKDVVYGANDGIITTFAVVAGVAGAALNAHVVLIIGAASLVADGLSMAASDFLASRSDEAVREQGGATEPSSDARIAASLTFVAFVVAGAMPLVPYVILVGSGVDAFVWAAAATGVTLFFVGAVRSTVTRRGFFRSGVEMLLIGGAAAAAAWVIGHLMGGLAPR